MIEKCESEDGAKLKALREAAVAGFGAIDRGQFKEFDSVDELVSYLHGISEKIIASAAE